MLALIELPSGTEPPEGGSSALRWWKWSVHVKPIAGTPLCEAPHFQYHVSGTLHVVMADGTEFDAGPGSITSLPAGHDAWVVDSEPVVLVDFFGATHYAKQ
ncbi:MAG: hypothetical protein V1750_04110 [Acidobacteriota bacterium]